MRILIVTGDTLAIGTDTESAATVIGIEKEVALADIVMTPEGKLLKHNFGTQNVEVRIA